jgi:hypothetical protein
VKAEDPTKDDKENAKEHSDGKEITKEKEKDNEADTSILFSQMYTAYPYYGIHVYILIIKDTVH